MSKLDELHWRILEFPETSTYTQDDCILIDDSTAGTRRLKLSAVREELFVELTSAQYEQLSPEAKSNPRVVYFIVDGPGLSASGVQDVRVNGASVVTNYVADINLNNKQDKLTAGSNIAINNNIISNTLTAGTNIEIDSNGHINATNTTYTAGENISIDGSNKISATDTTYTAGNGINISAQNVISSTSPSYTAGENITITNDNIISAKDTTYAAGENINIDVATNTISATNTTYTAGSNVQISNQNVISATDTTYSSFAGSDPGLVPAATNQDSGKFLKSDGTWATAGGNEFDTIVVNGTGYFEDICATGYVQADEIRSTHVGSYGYFYIGGAQNYALGGWDFMDTDESTQSIRIVTDDGDVSTQSDPEFDIVNSVGWGSTNITSLNAAIDAAMGGAEIYAQAGYFNRVHLGINGANSGLIDTGYLTISTSTTDVESGYFRVYNSNNHEDGPKLCILTTNEYDDSTHEYIDTIDIINDLHWGSTNYTSLNDAIDAAIGLPDEYEGLTTLLTDEDLMFTKDRNIATIALTGYSTINLQNVNPSQDSRIVDNEWELHQHGFSLTDSGADITLTDDGDYWDTVNSQYTSLREAISAALAGGGGSSYEHLQDLDEAIGDGYFSVDASDGSLTVGSSPAVTISNGDIYTEATGYWGYDSTHSLRGTIDIIHDTLEFVEVNENEYSDTSYALYMIEDVNCATAYWIPEMTSSSSLQETLSELYQYVANLLNTQPISGEYISTPSEKYKSLTFSTPIVDGSYSVQLTFEDDEDEYVDDYEQFTWSGSDVTLEFDSGFEVAVTSTTISMVDYSGDAKYVNCSVTQIDGKFNEVINVTQTVSSGTKIGNITVGGVSTDLYAPAAGASAINDLSDVNITSPANNQVLSYNSTTSKWENANASGSTINHTEVNSGTYEVLLSNSSSGDVKKTGELELRVNDSTYGTLLKLETPHTTNADPSLIVMKSYAANTYYDSVSICKDDILIQGSTQEQGFDYLTWDGTNNSLRTSLSTMILSGTSDPTSSIGRHGSTYYKIQNGAVVGIFFNLNGSWLPYVPPTPTPPSEYLYDWDFTQSAVDSVQGATIEMSSDARLDTTGIVYEGAKWTDGYVIKIPVDLMQPNKQVEIDFGTCDWDPYGTYYALYICWWSSDGSAPIYSGISYDTDSGQMITAMMDQDVAEVGAVSDEDCFSNSTMKIITSMSENNCLQWSVYKDDVLIGTSPEYKLDGETPFLSYDTEQYQPSENASWAVSACGVGYEEEPPVVNPILITGLRIKNVTNS